MNVTTRAINDTSSKLRTSFSRPFKNIDVGQLYVGGWVGQAEANQLFSAE